MVPPSPPSHRRAGRSVSGVVVVAAFLGVWVGCLTKFDLPAGSSGIGAVCAPSQRCESASTCAFEDQLCGTGVTGTCIDVDRVCSTADAASTATGTLYCGCNHKLYPSLCELYRAGTDVSGDGRCENIPADHFRCAGLYCSVRQYCSTNGNSDGRAASSPECRPYPATCTAHDCSCIDLSLGCSCDQSGGGATVLCKG
jgi:hypothetical protein